MLEAANETSGVWHTGYDPGEFPARWYDAAYDLHCRAWTTPWEGQLDRERFIEELRATHVDVLLHANGGGDALLAYLKWKATDEFHPSRDALSDPALPSLPAAPPAVYVCAYEITAMADRNWHGLGRRLLGEAIERWARTYGEAVFCTYSPKRGSPASFGSWRACNRAAARHSRPSPIEPVPPPPGISTGGSRGCGGRWKSSSAASSSRLRMSG